MENDFVQQGWIHLPEALDLTPGSRLRAVFDWTIRQSGLETEKGLDCPPGLTSLPPTRVADMANVAPRLWDAVCRILGGADRIRRPARIGNALICNYRTTTLPADWHVDGDFFVHHPDSPEQALLIFILWTDVLPGDGATEIAPGATAGILRYLAEHPNGCSSGQIPTAAFVAGTQERISLTGRAGDAWILHPLTAHRSTPNPRGEARFISNPAIALNTPLRLAAECTGSPLEEHTKRLLGGTGYTSPRIGKRRRFTPDRIARWSGQGTYTVEDSYQSTRL